MPGRRNPLDDPSEWTLHLQQGPDCSVGYSANEALNWDGTTSSGRQNEDRYYTCIHQDTFQLYMVLDGHDGSRAVKFAQSHIPHFLLHSELVGGGDKMVMDALRKAIVKTEREFFIGVDPYITRKVTLQFEIEQKATDSSTALRLFPSQIAEIGRLDDLIKGGTTVVAALLYNNKLYVANAGDSRALLCSQTRDGTLMSVQQLSVDHNTGNEDELRRLEGCGLDPSALRRAKRLGMQQNTRSIGDYSIKGGYTNVDIISHATREPGTAEPYLHEPINLSTFHGFLILMSDGLYEAYEAWTGRPEKINDDIAHLVAQELKSCAGDFKVVAQKVVDKVKVLYRDTCKRDRRSGRLDDITLIVKSLGVMLTRSQSTKLPYHQPSQYPEQPLTTAPITNRQFNFAEPYRQQPQSNYWERPRYPPGTGQEYPPRGPGQEYPPRGPGQEYPPRGPGQEYPPRGPGQEYPPRGPGQEYPPRGPGQEYPPRGPGQEYPPRGPGQEYPPRGPGHEYPPRGPGQEYPPRGPGHEYPPRGPGQEYPPGGPQEYSGYYHRDEHHLGSFSDSWPRQTSGAVRQYSQASQPSLSSYQPPYQPPSSTYQPPPSTYQSTYQSPSPSHPSLPPFSSQPSQPLPPFSHHHPPPPSAQPLPNPSQGRQNSVEQTPTRHSSLKTNDRQFSSSPTVVRPQQATAPNEEAPPPIPPRPHKLSSSSSTDKPPMSTISESDQEMYGWTPPEVGGSGPSPNHHQQGSQPVQEEPVTLKEEPQTLQEAPITFTAPPPQEVSASNVDEGPGTLQQEPQEPPQGAPHDGCCGDGSGGEEDGYLIFDDNDGEGSDNEDAVPDADGAIKPYIRFTDLFPSDLSWNDIAVDPLSS